MSEHLILRDGRRIELLSEEEDRQVTEAALTDPDAQPWTDEELANIHPQRFRFPNGDSTITLVVLPEQDEDEEATGSN